MSTIKIKEMESATTAAASSTSSNNILQSSKQTKNHIFLSTIKTKLATKDSDEPGRSPIKFPIPSIVQDKTSTKNEGNIEDPLLASSLTLRLSASSGNGTESTLNSFLLDQLNNKSLNGDSFHTNNGFILPKLQINSSKVRENIDVRFPTLSSKLNSNNGMIKKDDGVVSLSVALNKLQVNSEETQLPLSLPVQPQEKLEPESPLIDLTCALNTSHDIEKIKQRARKTEEKFNIPFIDCDKNTSFRDLTKDIVVNEYCQLDISKNEFNHHLTKPSPFGRVICASYQKKDPPQKYQMPLGESNHRVKRFLFDTQSPDDKVIEAMNKYKRP